MHHAIASNSSLVLGKIVEILVVDVVKEILEFSRRQIVSTIEGGNVLAEGEALEGSTQERSKTHLARADEHASKQMPQDGNRVKYWRYLNSDNIELRVSSPLSDSSVTKDSADRAAAAPTMHTYLPTGKIRASRSRRACLSWLDR
eukprot:scaffold29518_cov117-Skeletonema_dohrnii-CCMP3373.AAC.1